MRVEEALQVGDGYIVALLISNGVAEAEEGARAHAARTMLLTAARIARAVHRLSWDPQGALCSPAALRLEPGEVALRLGMAMGQVGASLVGLTCPRFHLRGEPLQRAARLESQASKFHLRMDEASAVALDLSPNTKNQVNLVLAQSAAQSLPLPSSLNNSLPLASSVHQVIPCSFITLSRHSLCQDTDRTVAVPECRRPRVGSCDSLE